MELIVRKIQGDNPKEDKAERLKIENLAPISTNRTFILVEKFLVSEEKADKDTYQFYPVLFIAVVKTRIGDILVAQFIGDYGAVDTTIISELPSGYRSIRKYHLIDYQGYQDICKITSEKPLSIIQYIKSTVGAEPVGINTIVMNNGGEYNYDQQPDMWKSIEQN